MQGKSDKQKLKVIDEQLLISLLCAVMLVLPSSVPASADVIFDTPTETEVSAMQSGETFDNYKYKVNEDGVSVTVTGCSKTDSEITVPSEIDGKAVTVIGKEAFFHCRYTKITLPEGITKIEEYAF